MDVRLHRASVKCLLGPSNLYGLIECVNRFNVYIDEPFRIDNDEATVILEQLQIPEDDLEKFMLICGGLTELASSTARERKRRNLREVWESVRT